MLFEWRRISEATAMKDLQEALKMIRVSHLFKLLNEKNNQTDHSVDHSWVD